MEKKISQTYEDFHKLSKPQINVVNDKNFTYRIVLKFINEFLISPKNILDIGCGAGVLSLYLTSRGNKVLGIDISENAILACKRSAKLLGLKDVSFKRMDFPNKIPTDKYDFVVCSEVIEHLKNDSLAIKRIYSLLNSGGIALISVPSKKAPLYRLGLAEGFDRKVGHLRRYDFDELVNKCKKHGFKIAKAKKSEGVIRNILFLNPVAGKFVRFIKFFVSDIFTFLDEISLKLFGESQIILVLKKP